MSDIETIDKLTNIIAEQSGIIREQAELLAQHEAVDALDAQLKKGEADV